MKDELETALKPYDLIILFEKEDLLSYLFMEEEIQGGKSMSTSLPMAFVGMAAVVLYLMLRRVIEQDRNQIGILKAFGYSDSGVLFHYVTYGLTTGVLGALLGLGISYLTISPYIGFYLEYYKLPISTAVKDYTFYYIGGIWAVGAGVIGAYFGARKVVKLKPADAMRPKAPPPVRKDNRVVMFLLRPVLTSRGFMTIRNILRNKVRSGFVIIGITFSYSMMVMIGMMSGMIDAMFFNQFNHILKYDVEISLHEMVPYDEA